MAYLWSTLSFLSYLTLLAFISVQLPGSAAPIIIIIFKVSQLDYLPSDLIFDNSLVFNNEDFFGDNATDFSFNEQFEVIGIDSMNLIRNMGSAFIMLNFQFAMTLYIFFQGWLIKKYPG
jgi:hypothetical protein